MFILNPGKGSKIGGGWTVDLFTPAACPIDQCTADHCVAYLCPSDTSCCCYEVDLVPCDGEACSAYGDLRFDGRRVAG